MKHVKLLLQVFCILQITLLGWADKKPHWGKCPEPDVRQEFNISPYQGMWYIQAGYNHEAVEKNISCFSSNYTFLYLTMGLSKVEQSWRDNEKNITLGRIGLLNQTDPTTLEGKFVETLRYDTSRQKEQSKPYWILDTDYLSYSVIYSCTPFLHFWHYYSLVLLSRFSEFPYQEAEDTFSETTSKVLEYHGFSGDVLRKAYQNNCTL